MNPLLHESFILKKWEPDFEEGLYFIDLKDGSSLGYDYQAESFSLHNYWNTITDEEADHLITSVGSEWFNENNTL